MIATELWDDEDVARLGFAERILLICMITDTALTDDYGRLPAAPSILKKHAFGYDDVSIEQVKAWRDNLLATCKNVLLYVVDDKEYIALANFDKWQKLRYKRQSKIPAPQDSPVSETLRETAETCENVTTIFPRVELSINREEKSREEIAPETPSSSSSKSVLPWAKVLAKAGILVSSQLESEMWADLADEAGPERFESAVQVAVEQNKRSLAYVRAVVRRSMAEGKMPGAAPPAVSPPDPPPKPKIRKAVTLINPINNQPIEAFKYVEDS